MGEGTAWVEAPAFMPGRTSTKQLLVWLLAVLMVWPWPLRLDAQGTGTVFKTEEIEQLVAPIALYPDELLPIRRTKTPKASFPGDLSVGPTVL